MIIRHLVLPGRVQNSLDVIRLIAAQLSKKVPLSLMSQYTPTPAVSGDPLFGRRVTREEYEAVVDLALDLEFENLFIQEVDERALAPDFEKAEALQMGGLRIEERGSRKNMSGRSIREYPASSPGCKGGTEGDLTE